MPTTFSGSFGFPSITKSKTVHGNNKTITKAKLTATKTGNVSFSLGLANNPNGTGVTFELVTSGTTHTFATTGKWLYWSAVGDVGAKVTKITIGSITES